MSTYADSLKNAADHVKDAGDELRRMDDREQYQGEVGGRDHLTPRWC
jgi:hypothetical protein